VRLSTRLYANGEDFNLTILLVRLLFRLELQSTTFHLSLEYFTSQVRPFTTYLLHQCFLQELQEERLLLVEHHQALEAQVEYHQLLLQEAAEVVEPFLLEVEAEAAEAEVVEPFLLAEAAEVVEPRLLLEVVAVAMTAAAVEDFLLEVEEVVGYLLQAAAAVVVEVAVTVEMVEEDTMAAAAVAVYQLYLLLLLWLQLPCLRSLQLQCYWELSFQFANFAIRILQYMQTSMYALGTDTSFARLVV